MRAPVIALAAVCTAATVFIIVLQNKKAPKSTLQKPLKSVVNQAIIPTQKNDSLLSLNYSIAITDRNRFSTSNLHIINVAKPQFALVTTVADTTIHFLEGTAIKLGTDDFVSETTGQPVSGPVRLQVSEHYKMEDILTENLSTCTEDGLLETNGMINIQAFAANGDRCKIRKDGSIEIRFPKVKKAGMQLFTALKDSSGNIIWKPVIVRNKKGPAARSNVAVTFTDTFKMQSPAAIDTSINRIAFFPGGLPAIEKNINSLKNPFPINNQGNAMVIADFNVNKLGNINDVRIKKSDNNDYSGALSEALYHMVGWQPAMVKGVSKTMTMRLAVSFSTSNPRLMKFWSCVKSPDTIKVEVNSGWSNREFYSSQNNANETMISDLVFKTTSLGWINCDRFYNTPAPKTDLYVAEKPDDNTSMKLVFHKIKSVLGVSYIGYKYAFTNVPVGEPVTLIAVRGTKDHLQMAVKTLRIGNEPVKDLYYTAVTAEDIKATMMQFNELPGAVARN